MKRNLDLCLQVLRAFEAGERYALSASYAASRLAVDVELVEYHCEIMADSGLLVAINHEEGLMSYTVYRLSWQGHEFLDAARNPTHWEQAKEVAHESSGGFDLMQRILATMAAEAAKAIVEF